MPKTILSLAAAMLLAGTLGGIGPVMRAQSTPSPLIRLADIEVDPAQVDAYSRALREEIETSIRVEPGVLRLYAVDVKDRPNQIRLFEMYADTAAYQAHLRSQHFKAYKSATAAMVKSLRLLEAEPVVLGSK